MARPERIVEDYLIVRVAVNGGQSEKFTSPNRRFVPDQIVMWPGYRQVVHDPPFFTTRAAGPEVHFVECKAPGEKCTPGQLRDHARRRALGFRVEVLDTKDAVDAYIRSIWG